MSKEDTKVYFDKIAAKRDKWKRRNKYYYNDLVKFLQFVIPEDSSVLEIGCGTGDFVNELKPRRGMGIDISPEMVKIAKEKYPKYDFFTMDAESLTIDEKFGFVILSDLVGHLDDVQKCFFELHKVVNQDTRIIVTYYNFFWEPFLRVMELLHLKMPQYRQNWLNSDDIANLLRLAGFDIIKTGDRLLFPKYFPALSWFLNKFAAKTGIFRHLCLIKYVIARKELSQSCNRDMSISIIIPARNEKGNIENAVLRIPKMGSSTEIIFVEGNSTDDTLREIKRVVEKYKDKRDLKWAVQDGIGKADAVWKGFDMANGDVLMILDADLTVPPEELTKFYDAISSGKGEFINGTRLVYPMEKEAMRFLNLIGNKLFSIIFTWLLEQKIRDTLCGTKVLSKTNYQKIKAGRKYFGNFDPFGDFDLLFGAAKLNLKIVEIPIRYKSRAYGETNISRWSHGWLLLKMCFFAMQKIKFT